MSPVMKPCIGTKHEACTTLIPIGTKRCPKHTLDIARLDYKRRGQARRGSAQRKVYDSARWKHTRNIVIARADHTCTLCGEPATIADHHPYPLTDLLARGLDPFDFQFCRALCAICSGHHDGPRSRRTEPSATIG